MRLDLYLQQYYPDISRSQLQKLIKAGKVTVNDIVQTKNGYELGEDDAVKVDFSSIDSLADTESDIPVLYEDDDCVVLNKPIGLLTHSKGAFNPELTVASWLASRESFNFANTNERTGIVHRLDRATSGVMVAAKNEKAMKHLQKQFQYRKVKKSYVARVKGLPEPDQAIIELPIERNPKLPHSFRVGQNGKPARTQYNVSRIIRSQTGTESIVELQPYTGRTHQLRVHLQYIKHPIVGDSLYGGREAERLYLHAHNIEITLPNKQRKAFAADVPKEFFKD